MVRYIVGIILAYLLIAFIQELLSKIFDKKK